MLKRTVAQVAVYGSLLLMAACSSSEDELTATALSENKAAEHRASERASVQEESISDAASVDETSIEWAADFEAARKQAQEEGRPLIAYFTFDGCVWCDRLAAACFDDPAVVELSRKLIWVKVDRDLTPEIPKQLNVSAYPSLLTLGNKLENIYRFQSYQEPPEFIGNLNAALDRFELYREGKEWMVPPERPERVIDQGRLEFLPAPSDQVPGGITADGNTIWVAQGRLYRIDGNDGAVLSEYPLPSAVGDLCRGDKELFAVTYGWTAGQPIYAIDPETGEVNREIVTETNRQNRSHGAKGIAYRNDRLYVLSGMVGKVFELDPGTGEISREIQLSGKWLSGLDIRGNRFITGGRAQLYEFDAESGELLAATPCNYPIRNIAVMNETILLLEQPIFGFGRQHERIQVWPQQTRIYRWRE